MHGLMFGVVIAAVAASPTPVELKQPQWIDSYGQALKAAKAKHQPLLVVLHDSSKTETSLPQLNAADETQRALLQPYVLCHVDINKAGGDKVAKAFRVTKLPHTAVIDNTGSVILHRHTGKFSAGQWARTLVKYQHGTRPVVRSLSLPAATTSFPSSFSPVSAAPCFT